MRSRGRRSPDPVTHYKKGRDMMNLLRILALAVVTLGMISSATAASIYKWKAEDGSISYGQFPPRGVTAVPVDGPSPPPASSPSPADHGETETAAQSETPAPARTEVRADDEEGMAAACDTARENIVILENPDVHRVQNARGESLSPEERESRMQEAQEFLDKWC